MIACFRAGGGPKVIRTTIGHIWWLQMVKTVKTYNRKKWDYFKEDAKAPNLLKTSTPS